MRNHLFVVLIVLIFSTSLNHGEKLKTNDRRASGLMAYPRIGRSDQPVSNVNYNRHREMEPDTEMQFYNTHDSDLDSASEKDYEDSRNVISVFNGRSMNPKHSDKIPKDSSWLITKEYRPWQKIDDGRSHHSNSLLLARGFRNSQMNGYTPRLGRESDADRTFCK
ncbi:CAPA peptides isoform X1 [Osmia lignaria lignaria]|uniref:CAPA peptides isoform X1 n=1 Tax=Osmia lignaria lignaria TaxID=1437193 RepID=UPI001478D515|nr:CAPA peptides-like isoform X1 [Osmia lignaria]